LVERTNSKEIEIIRVGVLLGHEIDADPRQAMPSVGETEQGVLIDDGKSALLRFCFQEPPVVTDEPDEGEKRDSAEESAQDVVLGEVETSRYDQHGKGDSAQVLHSAAFLFESLGFREESLVPVSIAVSNFGERGTLGCS
jgi:hypothetical protein